MSEVTVLSTARQRGAMPLRGRSYMAFALTPEPPIADWLEELDAWLRGSSGFFAGRPVVVRIMGLEGVGPEKLNPSLPPLVSGGRPAPVEAVSARSEPAPPPPAPQRALTSLLVESAIRSGQAIFHPDGDVTVLGSVGSGAEVMAGGSIHIYGTLRGRAMAGTSGNRQARIFCRHLEAELLAIDGYYRTAEDLDAELRTKPIQAWLADETLFIAQID